LFILIINKMQNNRTDRDKVAGTLIGLAVGDALGAPHEFKTQRSNVYTGLLYIPPTYSFRNGKRTDVIAQYTDDTEMALCIMRSVVEKGHYDRDSVILQYLQWADKAKAMGKNTRALFKGIKTIKGYQTRWNGLFLGTDKTTWTQSNGSLMRCCMLAFLPNSEEMTIDCRLTNPHQLNIDANIAYCAMIKCSSMNYKKEIVVKCVLETETLCKEIRDVVSEAIGSKVFTRDMTSVGKGWVLHALYCAVWGWYHFDTYQDPIDIIIKAGGDTDTNAAIAGALIGANLGYAKLMQEERTSHNIQLVRTADFSKGENPRPDYLCLHDFDQLIDDFMKCLV